MYHENNNESKLITNDDVAVHKLFNNIISFFISGIMDGYHIPRLTYEHNYQNKSQFKN